MTDERMPSVGSLPAGFDDWKTRAPDVPTAKPVTKRETCEVCGASVAAVSVARCGGHFSYWPSRPERRGGR